MLSLHHVRIDTYPENVIYLNRRCVAFQASEYQEIQKIQVFADGDRITGRLTVVDDDSIVNPDQVGLSSPAFSNLGLAEGTVVELSEAMRPRSLAAVRRKILGHALDADDIRSIVHDIVEEQYTKMDIAAFLAGASGRLSGEEVLSLTEAMVEAGTRLSWDHEPVADKHCVGGIPGNRTSMIVVPIVAAYGLTIPKTSSRAITSSAGTADTMEVLADVNLDLPTIRKVVRATGGCLVWGGSVDLSPADDRMIMVERALSFDSAEQMVASILSKKIAAGATHLVIDLPVGPRAKVRNEEELERLTSLFEFVGEHVGLSLKIITTDGSDPVGNGIGPVLEAIDVLKVLDNAPDAPTDLRAKSLELASKIIEFDPACPAAGGLEIATGILTSGKAREKMEAIREAQGMRDGSLTPGAETFDVLATENGSVSEIDCYRISRIARIAGAPAEKGSGLRLHAARGETVKKGDLLYTVHAERLHALEAARHAVEEDHGFALGTDEDP